MKFLFLILLAISTDLLAAEPVDHRMTGAWYDPSHDGEGYVVEVLDADSALVFWYTYDEAGGQRWFTGTGSVNGSRIEVPELLAGSGAKFGMDFDPDDVVLSPAGSLVLDWLDCMNARAEFTIDGEPGSLDVTRLTALAGRECDTHAPEGYPQSGSWYDVTHNGEGLTLEILADNRVLAFWFSYDDERNPAWFLGVGELQEDHIWIENMYRTHGGRFGPAFDPDEVELERWGSVQIELGCDYGKMDYVSDLPEFGEGKQTLFRLTNPGSIPCSEQEPPNILLVIADDLGLDASSQYAIAAEHPVTPTLDQLADEGLVFDNAWSNPTCSPTRAGILTGKYGARTGVLTANDDLSEDETSLQSYIDQRLPGKYTDAVIGKWHLGPQPGGLDHPADMGIGHFAGIIGGGVDDYEDWTLVTDGQRSDESQYATSKLADLAVEWTSAQESPWFLWLAFNAPHTPFHLPPAGLHDRNLPGTEEDIEANPLPYYFAAIEAMDTEIGRLLDSLDPSVRANTIVIFMGDNGTPNQVAQSPYGRGKAKDSLYQGGINIPLFISGPGVTRIGERESGLVNTTDLFGTIAALAGVNVSQVHDSNSFQDLLSEVGPAGRLSNYSEQSSDTGVHWAISDGVYKQIESNSGTRELYQLPGDPYEETDLVATGTAPAEVMDDLQYLADQIRFGSATANGFAIVDTDQQACYDDSGAEISCPARSEAFYGQDAQYANQPSGFIDKGDGTVSDKITGLTWQQSPDTNQDKQIDADDKLSFSEAKAHCDELNLAGSTDWRLPEIKQLYSLINFNGIDPSGYEGSDISGLVPFIDTAYFDFGYGDIDSGERIIDAQYASSTLYVSTTGNAGVETMFGVNFADGRIKGYGLSRQGLDTTFYVICTRGNEVYGNNDFVANDDGTVTDNATGLMWAVDDSLVSLNWEEALDWIAQQNSANYLGYSDWKLPNAKELQSLVDYSRSPDSSESAALDPIFNATGKVNEAGEADYPAYWTSTTHLNQTANPGANGVYVSFGRSMGYINGSWVDIHGAGAQRSDPKSGNPDDYPVGRGPQGDAIRIYNYVRLVRSTN